MRLAYADPPYVGCSGFYDHPDAARWDDPAEHVALMTELDEEYDGWALSCSTPSLRGLLPGAPARARVAAWVKPFAAFKRNVRIAYTWEPVIFAPGRDRSADGAPVGRDHLAASITLKRGLTGAKPAAFNRWVLDLLGYVIGDELVDLFPGTGGMERILANGSQGALALPGDADDRLPHRGNLYASGCDLCETDGHLHLWTCPNNPLRVAAPLSRNDGSGT